MNEKELNTLIGLEFSVAVLKRIIYRFMKHEKFQIDGKEMDKIREEEADRLHKKYPDLDMTLIQFEIE